MASSGEAKPSGDDAVEGKNAAAADEVEKARVQTDEEYESFLDRVMPNFDNFLQKFQNYLKSNPPEKVTEQPRPLIEYLSWLYEFYGQMGKFKMTEKQLSGYRVKAGAKLAEYQGLIDSMCRCAIYLYKRHRDDAFVSQSPETETQCEHGRVYTSLILGNFHNYSDCSLEFCIALSKSEFFFTELASDALTVWFDRHAVEEQTTARSLVNNVLGITYNMFFKNNSQIYDSLSRTGVVDSVKPYLHSSDVEIQVHALILIAFALDESQAGLYLGAKEVMEFLVGHLADSIDRPDRRSKGYHTIELAVCVNRLALNDVNKKLLMETELLPALLRMCQGGRPDETAAALDILFTLSFLTDNRDRILAEFGDALRALMVDPVPRAEGSGDGLWRECRSLQGLDFNLNEQLSCQTATGKDLGGRADTSVRGPAGARPQTARQLRRRATSTDPEAVPACVLQGAHVMISYQHECKQTVCRIRDELARAGIKVWIDYERMGEGSTLGAMADAVECSYAFLMCMSRKYKESNNCRVEAEYAWRLGKRVVPLLLETKYKPTGWLGIMLGVNIYLDFSGKYPFEAKAPELLRVLTEAREAARGVAEPGGSEPTVTAELAHPVGASRPSSAASAAGGREHHFPSPYHALPPIGAAAGGGPRTAGLRAWTAAEARTWAEGRGLAGTPAADAGLTGEELHFLAGCRRSAPDAFFRLLDRHLAFERLRDLAVFANALDDL